MPRRKGYQKRCAENALKAVAAKKRKNEEQKVSAISLSPSIHTIWAIITKLADHHQTWSKHWSWSNLELI